MSVLACALMETMEAIASDEPMSSAPPSDSPQPQEIPSDTHMGPPTTLPPLHAMAATAAATTTIIPRASLAVVPTAVDSSPAALLAASLVRSRATYFEQLSLGFRISASSSQMSFSAPGPPQDLSSGGRESLPMLRQDSTALTSQPLHPLAQHPLSGVPRSGGGGPGAVTAGSSKREEDHNRRHQRHQQRRRRQPRWQRQQQRQGNTDDDDSDEDEDDSVDTFFDKPSYTCYGATVEMAPASSYGAGNPQAPAGPCTEAAAQPPPPPLPSQQVAEASADSYSSSDSSPASSAAGPDSSGYVRSMSAHFARVSSVGGSGRRGSVAGMDGLFDDVLAHVGALLASHPDVEAQMGMVQGLSDRLLQLHAVCETLGRKEDEVEHLRGVLRELTTTRAEAIRLKVQMAESLNGLQQEYYKVLRSAQLAQGTCKQHSARAAATRKQLMEVQSELLRYKRAVVALRDRNRRLRSENEDMGARLHALEQGKLGSEGHRSACYMALVQAQTPVLY